MAQTSVTPLFRDTRSDWVRLQTLTQLRWLAIAGQLLAIAVGHMFLDLRLPLAACLGAVGLSMGLYCTGRGRGGPVARQGRLIRALGPRR